MRLLSLIFSIIAINFLIDVSNGENTSFNKSCYVRYLLQNKQIDEKYRKLISKKEPNTIECGKAVSQTLKAIRESSKEPCIVEFLNKPGVAEVLLRKFLLPQLDNGVDKVTFQEDFTAFRKKVVDTSSVVCSNPRIFRPDLAKHLREARNYKESKPSELKCLEQHIKSPNKVLTDECRGIVESHKSSFYKRMENEVKGMFAPPRDNLFSLECSLEQAEKLKFFERIYFFILLAATRQMSDAQIDSLANNANKAVYNSQKVFYECMK